MEKELFREKAMEYANEIEDGQYDVWLDDNRARLAEDFARQRAEDFEDFCKNEWNMFKRD